MIYIPNIANALGRLWKFFHNRPKPLKNLFNVTHPADQPPVNLHQHWSESSPACPAYDRKAGMGSRIMEILLPMMQNILWNFT